MKLKTPSTDFRKISNFIQIRLVGAELFHAGRRTDMTKLKVAFRSFEKALKMFITCVIKPRHDRNTTDTYSKLSSYEKINVSENSLGSE